MDPIESESEPYTFRDPAIDRYQAGQAAGPWARAPPSRVDPEGRTIEETREVTRVPGRFSPVAGLMGWAVATLFAGIIAGGLAFAFDITDAAAVLDMSSTELILANAGIVLFALFVGYFLGGYTAGRMAKGAGGVNGLGVVAWTVVIGVLAAFLGNFLVDAQLPASTYVPVIGVTNFTVIGVASLIVAFVVMLGGAYLGGRVGDHSWAGAERVRVRRVERRGRPL